MELAIKALVKEISSKDAYGHNIKHLWETHIPSHDVILPEKIDAAFQVLEKYNILKDEELFRYHG